MRIQSALNKKHLKTFLSYYSIYYFVGDNKTFSSHFKYKSLVCYPPLNISFPRATKELNIHEKLDTQEMIWWPLLALRELKFLEKYYLSPNDFAGVVEIANFACYALRFSVDNKNRIF